MQQTKGKGCVGYCMGGDTYWNVRYSNTGGCAGLSQAEALHHGAAEADFEELLNMVGQRSATCHNDAHLPSQPSLDLGKHQLVKEWRSLHKNRASVRCFGARLDL